MGISSSTLHFTLDKMVEKDIIVRCRTDPKKKTVIYSACSDTVFIGYDPYENLPDVEAGSSLGFLMKVYLKSIGIDARMLEKWYSEAVSESMTRFLSHCNLEEAIFIAKRLITKATGYRISVFSVNPLTVIIDGDDSLKGFLDMILNAFSSIVYRLSGTNLSAEPVEERSEGGMTRFTTVFGPSNISVTCRSIRKNTEMQRFAIVERNGWTKVLTSDTQIELLRFISGCPSNMQQIQSCFDMPRSTLAYNIGKMIEEGLLEFHMEENESYYFTDYNIFLTTSGSPKVYSGIDFLDEGRGFMDGYLRYVAS